MTEVLHHSAPDTEGSGSAALGPAVTKAVIPVAGLGTRFLPVTKATPKEMLPVVDKPAIQYVVEEAVAAGLPDVLMITGRNKASLENHFDRAFELEDALEAKGDEGRLASVRESSHLADIHYVRQGDPHGLGHAVLCARNHVGDHPFAVLLGDDLIDARDPLLPQMIDGAAAEPGQRGRLDGGAAGPGAPVRLRGGRARRTPRTSSGSPAWWRSRTRPRRPATWR